MSTTSGIGPWDGDPSQALAIAQLLRRVAGAAGVHVYAAEVTPDGGYTCQLWIGGAVERLLGTIPPGMDVEDAWEACVHPDDRPAYDDAYRRQCLEQETELEYRMVAFDGRVRWLWERCMPGRGDRGEVLIWGIVTDITERRGIQDQLTEAADRDPLTGLYNRRWFERHLNEVLERRGSEGSLGILFIDLDGFKLVNDRHGHAVGDDLIVEVARRMRETAGGLPVARLGGDEFLALYHAQPGVASPASAGELAALLEETLTRPYEIESTTLWIGASIGVATVSSVGCSASALQRAADSAMYATKLRRRGKAA
jgi:diguanylate cyclase (GGDEF)-like protein/PAS domain S-box-containing protein